jgi:hypothetical protein
MSLLRVPTADCGITPTPPCSPKKKGTASIQSRSQALPASRECKATLCLLPRAKGEGLRPTDLLVSLLFCLCLGFRLA